MSPEHGGRPADGTLNAFHASRAVARDIGRRGPMAPRECAHRPAVNGVPLRERLPVLLQSVDFLKRLSD